VSMARGVIEAVAKATDEELEELLEAATRSARYKAERAKLEAEKVEQDLRRMSRERLLPDEKTLEKVARYEAHLSRLFHKKCMSARRYFGICSGRSCMRSIIESHIGELSMPDSQGWRM
jgi:hypothetical protein